jgi:putative peptidoglycan lipid II flippase
MFSMNNILGRAFYALNDIKTPMRISVLCLALNLGFAFWLVQPYREAGLGVANTLSASLNLVLLVYALRRKLTRLGMTQVVHTLMVLVPAAMLAGVIAWVLGWLWQRRLGHGTLPVKLGAVFVPGGIAVLVYWGVALWTKVPAAHDMAELFLRRFRRARRE